MPPTEFSLYRQNFWQQLPAQALEADSLRHLQSQYALGLDQYAWNEVPNSHQVKDKADEIKEEGLWQEVRDRYLEKKNMYLSRQDRNHPSFVVYVEAVNEIYNRYFDRRVVPCEIVFRF